MRLQDRVAVITGAASGFGRAGAVRFATEGAKVVVNDRDPAGLTETVALVEAADGEAVAVVGDVTDATADEAAVASAVETYGGLDVLWANAGVPQSFRAITEIEPAEFDRIAAVNAICPLGAETPMRARFLDGYLDLDEASKTFAAAVPLGRLATVDDVAAA